MRAPEFWSRTDFASRALAGALSPLGWAYGASVAWKHNRARPYRARTKVICVGNLTAGGSGKTPVAIALARMLAAKGLHPFILARGYGGTTRGPRQVDPAKDRATEVGDEALILAAAAPTIVARDRRAGVRLADVGGADIVVMDDGHQNFSIAKDCSIVVVDGASGFGNGRLVPAGPLRESVAQGFARADALIVVGNGATRLPDFSGQVLRANLAATGETSFAGRRIVAFCGIGRPEKFFETARLQGAEIVATRRFADHHRYARTELANLRETAARERAQLVTTEKDFVRLDPAERQGIGFLPVRAQFETPQAVERLLDDVMAGRLPGARP